MKTIVIIGGGPLQIPAIEKAKRMGLRTIVTDYDSNAIGLSMADIPVVMSTKDIEGSVRAARDLSSEMSIHGVLTVGTDASMTVAAVANALGVIGIRYEDAEAASNKIKMRQRFKENDVPSPKFFQIWTLNDAINATNKIGFPCVIKPADNMGARGVRAIRNKGEVELSFRNAKAASPSGEIIVEEFMEGPELSIDALIYNKKVYFVGIADRIIGHFPFFIEMGHTLPSILPDDAIKEAKDVMIAGIRALNIDNGSAKGDIKITSDGAKIGELAARLSGGFMSAYTFPLATGADSIQGAIEIALGMPPTKTEPRFNKTSAERAIVAPPGLINSITGISKARKQKYIYDVFMRRKTGEICPPLNSNMDKIGNVLSVADKYDDAVKACEDTVKMIKIEIGTPPGLTEKEILNSAKSKLRNAFPVRTLFDDYRYVIGNVPGFGSIGTGASYSANFEALRNYRIITRYIHNVRDPDTSFSFLGRRLNTPILAAPITGMRTNLGLDIDEKEYNIWILRGCRDSGSIGCVGDGATPEKYKLGVEAIRLVGGWGIPFFKPRANKAEILKRIKHAEEAGAIAVGIDIDGAAFITMKLKNQPVEPKTVAELKSIIKSTELPFIIKGIMSVDDAEACYKAGVSAIIISNHGGRILDYMPGALHVLPDISKRLKGKITILVDGGIRSGADVFKCIAAGADAVLVGRPLCIAAIGSADKGASFIIDKLTNELKTTMLLTGCKSIDKISSDNLLLIK